VGSGSLIHIILLRCYCETLAIIASLNFCSKSIGRSGSPVRTSGLSGGAAPSNGRRLRLPAFSLLSGKIFGELAQADAAARRSAIRGSRDDRAAREAGARLVPQMPRCAPGANLRFGLGSSENHRPRGGGRCSRGAASACALGSSQNRLRRGGGSRCPPVLVVRLSSVSPLIIQRDAHQPQRRAVSGCGIRKSCAQGRSYLNVSPDRLLS
jgi:hypothetical protein